MSTAVGAVMDAGAARLLTDEVKADAQALWSKLLALYRGGAHTVLGYSSWANYAAAEFGHSRSHAYRMLDAARVVAELPESPMGERPSERVVRELAPLREAPEQLREAWTEAVETHGPAPTAEQVREVVEPRKPRGREEVLTAFAEVDTGVANAVAVRDSTRALARVEGHIFELRRIDLAACEPVLDDADRDRLKRLTDYCDRALGEIATLRDAAVQRLRPVRRAS